jgi:transcriptional regulator with XRE-family HTH domain
MKKEIICRLVGERLRAIRNQKGLTQAQVAEKARLNDKYYSEVERGIRNITLVNLQKISKALGVPLGEIFRFSVKRETSVEEQEVVAIMTHLLSKTTDAQKQTLKHILKGLEEMVG